MVSSRPTVRAAIAVVLAACLLLGVLIATGVLTSPFRRSHVRRVQVWLRGSQATEGNEACSCVWRIGCPKFSWQTNFTSPAFRCGYQPMLEGLVTECLAERRSERGRDLRLHVAGHVREAFLVDYMRQRLWTTVERQTCRLTRPAVGPKPLDGNGSLEYSQVRPEDGGESCEAVHVRPGLRLDYRYVDVLGPDTLGYVDHLMTECEAEGCEGDILIFSGGVGELLNSTLLDSFTGVRRFQRQYKRLLPMFIDLVSIHKMEVVVKIHEPVTDELIPDNSMVRNDLLQEYNALIMEQTMSTPVEVWTSHMIMKLHHIEECDLQANSTTPNEDRWRCEEELVAGDQCHDEYFDTIFNKVCETYIKMPLNPCCSA
ncbi:uncharacterized protein LOC119091840 [Pollicipes pollicipes]|uniref:uncharacterized protein LOC119091840 n=1 Tax=Pollicipes pollicipes TaxID=41117 RepID=UPI001884C4B9|nr:uncharacterized protein LOC119091840 [Pollicipes pollicipes]